MSAPADGQAPVRVDRWLWAARLVKTRPLGTDAARGGHVEVDGRTVRPSREVRPGDTVALTRGGERIEVVVRATAERRGPASAAVQLYDETPASIAARERAAAERRLAGPPPPPAGPRPTKRDRRLLDRERGRER